MLKVCYTGNFHPSASTESHVALSLESLGHRVVRIQEGDTPAPVVADIVLRESPDLYLHTQTFGLAASSGTLEQRTETLQRIQDAGIPNAFFHLDKWLGLDREEMLKTEPWTKMAYVFTADGSSPERWEELGINHHWLPPGVVHTEAIDGIPRAKFRSDVVFVGSHTAYAHQEHWPKRRAMLDTLRRHFGRRFVCWPKKTAVRGMELTDLYASVKVAVGDSCLTGSTRAYWSDRCPESVGRGAVLVHPCVEGLETVHPYIQTYEQGDWNSMLSIIDNLLSDDDLREKIRVEGSSDVRTNHTYRNRLQTVIDTIGLA